ncbi:MAG: chromate efflux transporter [Brevundimonas sp.]|uniref:chromate efflux transporter n=1 Tax=Brevundimonas sp. TaxID=1871086 RepID=UPI00391D7A08
MMETDGASRREDACMAQTEIEPVPPPMSHGRLFWTFLKFGLTAWGGPVAQIAMIRHALVDQQGWISSARFNRLLGVMQALPGPEAHELCVHLGMRAKGRLGGLLAGLGFMAPGLVLMMLLSWAYFAIGIDGGLLGAAFLGVQVTVIALILRAVHRIGRHALTDPVLWMVALACAIAALVGAPFWLTLPAAGVVYALARMKRPVLSVLAAAGAGLAALVMISQGEAVGVTGAAFGETSQPATLAGLLLIGLKAGLLTFGGAYTAIPFVRDDAVGRGWISESQFLDGLAISGVLPAPLIIFATFVGYAAGGPWGALAMTLGVFAPAFAFSLIFYDRLEALVENRQLHALLEGVTAGVVGLIAAATLELGFNLATRVQPLAVAAGLFALALAVLYLWPSRWATPAVVALGAAGGVVLLSS